MPTSSTNKLRGDGLDFFGRLNEGRDPLLSCVNVVAKKLSSSSAMSPGSRRTSVSGLMLVMEALVNFSH